MAELISLGGNLCCPANSKPSDYTVTGPSQGAAGMAVGSGLVKQSDDQESPRRTQDSGDQTPSVWGKAPWTVGVSKGESATPAGSLSIPQSIDFSTGQISPNVKVKSDV